MSAYSMDRGVRILGGGVLICLALLNDTIVAAGACAAVIVGMYGVVTGIINYCPLSRLIALEKSRRRKSRDTCGIGADELRGLSFFQNLSEEELERLLACGTVRDCPAGETVLREGETPAALFIIVDGACAMYGAAEPREGSCAGALGPGDLFGVESLTGMSTSRFSVITTRTARILVMSRNSLQRFFKENPGVEIGMLRAALAQAIRYEPVPKAHREQTSSEHA